MRKATLLATLVAGISAMAMQAAHAVEIQYWQYVFDTRVKAMDELIANFQKANPDI
ncbi:ABC transporter substrate-binding protein, partial [Salmonella enterica subsp. enterica serovar Typhi]|nr:ABC transporter substrate-binding protein [Salmonella enterica subsp. enterica serovar Typhi]